MKRFFLVLALSLYSLNSYCSQFFDEMKEDASSPFNTSAIYALEIGGGLTIVSLIFNDESKRWQANLAKDRPLKKYSKLGDILGQTVPNVAYALAMGADYLMTKDQKSLDRTILMTKATLYSGALTDVMKWTINEKRPNGSKHSFPSGHTTTAFAFSSVVAMEHSLPWGIAANTMAAFVGFSRMNDNAHFLHDVLAGATIGTMYGVGVWNAKQNRDEKKSSQTVFMLVPLKDGLAANYAFDF